MKTVKKTRIRPGYRVNGSICELETKATIANPYKQTSIVIFSPSVKRQKELAHFLGTPEDEGFSGQFVVQYDIEVNTRQGEVSEK